MSVKMNQKRNKRRLTAGLDKVGFIEAQGLPWETYFMTPALKGQQIPVATSDAVFCRPFRAVAEKEPNPG
jgi:hypothetical protein